MLISITHTIIVASNAFEAAGVPQFYRVAEMYICGTVELWNSTDVHKYTNRFKIHIVCIHVYICVFNTRTHHHSSFKSGVPQMYTNIHIGLKYI